MAICKAPTLRLKVLNKHYIYDTHDVHRDRKCYQQFNKKMTHNADINKGSSLHAHTHARTHARTHSTD